VCLSVYPHNISQQMSTISPRNPRLWGQKITNQGHEAQKNSAGVGFALLWVLASSNLYCCCCCCCRWMSMMVDLQWKSRGRRHIRPTRVRLRGCCSESCPTLEQTPTSGPSHRPSHRSTITTIHSPYSVNVTIIIINGYPYIWVNPL